jgi:hypothetical protein
MEEICKTSIENNKNTQILNKCDNKFLSYNIVKINEKRILNEVSNKNLKIDSLENEILTLNKRIFHLEKENKKLNCSILEQQVFEKYIYKMVKMLRYKFKEIILIFKSIINEYKITEKKNDIIVTMIKKIESEMEN